jgi:hypothetical protein
VLLLALEFCGSWKVAGMEAAFPVLMTAAVEMKRSFGITGT